MWKKTFSKFGYRGKTAVSLLIFFLLAYGAIFFLIIPSENNLISYHSEMAAKLNSIGNQYSQGKNTKKTSESLKTIEPRLDEMNKIFTQKNNAFDFVTSLETTAEKNNVSEKASLGEEKSLGGEFSSISIELGVSGKFNNLISFLSDLEKMPNYININSLQIFSSRGTISSLHKASSSAALTAQISADSYWKK
jgi:Tfp pilus assembly protein PilO